MLARLNPEQRAAVQYRDGPLLVLAGAGSGKTRVITVRIAHLLGNGVPPHHMLAVTFTNKAAREMRERAEALITESFGAPGAAKGLWIGTFHSICARLLRIYGDVIGLPRGYVIYDTDDQRSLMRGVMKDLDLPQRLVTPAQVLHDIDQAKNNGVRPDAFQVNGVREEIVQKAYATYQNRLARAGAVDFGDLLMRTLELLDADPDLETMLADRFEHVLVDEFQDTNPVQYALVQRLSGKYRNLCVVGDDDQSIYAWRGADISNILDFERDYPDAHTVKLERNYRSTQVILDAAHAVISRNAARKAKKLWTERKGGALVRVCTAADERHEARFVATQIRAIEKDERRELSDFAIFYRMHSQSRVLEESLSAAGLPYQIFSGIRFYERAEIKDLLGYLKLIVNPADDVALSRVINVPARGIGKSSLEKLGATAQRRRVSVFEVARLVARAKKGDAEADIVGAGPRRKIRAFVELFEGMVEASKRLSLAELADHVLDATGYLEKLASEDTDESRARVENLGELVSSIRHYEKQATTTGGAAAGEGAGPAPGTAAGDLAGFLEQVSLASEVDGYDVDAPRVTLMTVHSAKGLEFPVVFVVGLEHNIFPHARSVDDPEGLEEERRLAYVAYTRAEQRLILSHAQQRTVFGRTQVNAESEFLRVLPESVVGERARRGMLRPTYRTRPPGAPSERWRRRDHVQQGWDWQDQNRDPRPAWDDASLSQAPAHAARRQPQAATRPAQRSADDVWVDTSFNQDAGFDEGIAYELDDGFRIGMRVRHRKFGVGEIRGITGAPPEENLVIYFSSVGAKKIRSRFVERA